MGVLVGPILKSAKNGQKWPKMAKNGGFWGVKGPKMGVLESAKNGQKMSKKRQKMVKKCPVYLEYLGFWLHFCSFL